MPQKCYLCLKYVGNIKTKENQTPHRSFGLNTQLESSKRLQKFIRKLYRKVKNITITHLKNRYVRIIKNLWVKRIIQFRASQQYFLRYRLWDGNDSTTANEVIWSRFYVMGRGECWAAPRPQAVRSCYRTPPWIWWFPHPVYSSPGTRPASTHRPGSNPFSETQ